MSSASGFPDIDYPARRERVRSTFGSAGVEAMLIISLTDVRYLTGFSGSNATLLVHEDPERDILVTDMRYRERSVGSAVPRVELERSLSQVLRDEAILRLGVDPDHLTLGAADRLLVATGQRMSLLHMPDALGELRAVKDPAEVARIVRACEITVDTFSQVATEGIPEGIREADIVRRIEDRLRANGADGVAFPPIVAFGVNTASPHHESRGSRSSAGDPVLIDAGAQVDGYRADMTRMFVAGRGRGTVAAEFLDLHALVVEAQDAAVQLVGPGVMPSEVDALVRERLLGSGTPGDIAHPAGHGLGLDIHERPILGPMSRAPLVADQALAIEPGLYRAGRFGARIEDTVLVTAGGRRRLTDFPRTIDEIAVFGRRAG